MEQNIEIFYSILSHYTETFLNFFFTKNITEKVFKTIKVNCEDRLTLTVTTCFSTYLLFFYIYCIENFFTKIFWKVQELMIIINI